MRNAFKDPTFQRQHHEAYGTSQALQRKQLIGCCLIVAGVLCMSGVGQGHFESGSFLWICVSTQLRPFMAHTLPQKKAVGRFVHGKRSTSLPFQEQSLPLQITMELP